MAAAPSDADLIRRARDGDDRAFRRLVERYQDQVAATVIGMLGPGAEADDVGQETFIRFYRALDQFRGEAALGTYLTRIAVNQALKALRRRTRWRDRVFSRDDADVSLDEPAADGSEAVEAHERAEWVHRALKRLSPDHRAVVVLRLLKGYSTRETADILNVPEGTVMSRLSRATDRLEAHLKPLLE